MTISSTDWQAYPWKNELQKQAGRAVTHAREVLAEDFRGDHDPLAMMERAIVLSAFSVRRMVEKRLLTDRFVASPHMVRSFPAVDESRFRPPFHRSSGGDAFDNYNFSKGASVKMKPGDLANELIHSSQLMVVGEEELLADGFLVASDWHLKRRLLHLTFEEFQSFVDAVLCDHVYMATDKWDPSTGAVSSERRAVDDG